MLQRLQEADDRNQELTTTISQGVVPIFFSLAVGSISFFISTATKPLLRQIENLQSAHATQSANWEKVETNLNQRLGE